MTKAEICNRLRDELDAFEQRDRHDGIVFMEDFDVLEVALDDAIGECREWIESQFSGERVKES